MNTHKVVIIGGGFTGVKTALELQKKALPQVKITLISDRENFEYHGALYRFVAGHSLQEVCLPLDEILDTNKVSVIIEQVEAIDKDAKQVTTSEGGTYQYDTLVIGLGAETNYFGIEGMEEFSFGMKTIDQALELQNHIKQTLSTCVNADIETKRCASNIVVVGAGATGVELAGELAVYARDICRKNNLDPNMVNIELIEAAPRILPRMTEDFSTKVEEHLRSLGVNIRCSRAVNSIDSEHLEMSDMEMDSPTVIWTAGVRANHLVTDAGFEVDRTGRAVVNNYLQPHGYEDVFIGGDAAATEFSGMAQTAIADGKHFADCIEDKLEDRVLREPCAKPPIYAIPAGPGWAGVEWGTRNFYGKTGWFIRRLVDWVVFINFLPFGKALKAFRSHYKKS